MLSMSRLCKPTVLEHVVPEMKVVCEEGFVPVAHLCCVGRLAPSRPCHRLGALSDTFPRPMSGPSHAAIPLASPSCASSPPPLPYPTGSHPRMLACWTTHW